MAHGTNNSQDDSGLLRKAVMLVVIAAVAGILTKVTGGNRDHVISVSVFAAIVAGTLFFWGFRLAIAFLGLALLLMANVLDITKFVESASLEVILFLVGMMIVVGALRDLGFFTWVIQSIIRAKGMTGLRFVVITAFVSAILACLVDEVTSIIFMAVLIFQVCDTLKIKPTPYLIISVMMTNIGSSGTMLGNPVGIYIGTKAQLTFEDFMIWSFPVMTVALLITATVVLYRYRKDIALFEENLKLRREKELGLGPLVHVSPLKGFIVLIGTVGFIALHHRLEQAFGLRPNTVLLMAPLVSSGIIMIFKRDRARHYVESDVDWWTLTFFMLLFAVAGTLEYTGFTDRLADGFRLVFHGSMPLMVAAVAVISALGSAFVDNVVFVAAFVPVVQGLADQGLHAEPLWWALLFGACYGGNITMIGSTANIVAIGMLEKKYRVQIKFWEWFKVGLLAGGLSTGIAIIAVIVLTPLMPNRNAERLQADDAHGAVSAPLDASGDALHETSTPAGDGAHGDTSAAHSLEDGSPLTTDASTTEADGANDAPARAGG